MRSDCHRNLLKLGLRMPQHSRYLVGVVETNHGSGFRYPPDRAEIGRNLSHCSCKVHQCEEWVYQSEISDLSDDDNAANKTFESPIPEGEPNSDESDEETHGNT
ncbi:hypothetical protein TNCV_4763521 [Trichonephila clavipes]|nr:hypothetical protein TNCV_4763521 [Trichonephila clavipes]